MIATHLIERITVEAFCQRYGVTVNVHERWHVAEGRTGRFYASLDGVEIAEGGMLIGTFSDGRTIEEAVAGLPEIYSNRPLVIGAWTPKRRNVGPFVFVEKQE